HSRMNDLCGFCFRARRLPTRLRQHLLDISDLAIQSLVLEVKLFNRIDAQADLNAVLDERRFPWGSGLQALFGAYILKDRDAGRVGGDAVPAGDDDLGLGDISLGRAAKDEGNAAVQNVERRLDA